MPADKDWTQGFAFVTDEKTINFNKDSDMKKNRVELDKDDEELLEYLSSVWHREE